MAATCKKRNGALIYGVLVTMLRVMIGKPDIRRATLHDLVLLTELARTTFAHAFGCEMGIDALETHLEEKMSEHLFSKMMHEDIFLVAQDNDDLIGFVQIGSVNTDYSPYLEHFDDEASEIRRLYVLAARQQDGLGSALLFRGLKEVANGRSVYLTTWESNHGAQKLYRKFGFSKLGQIPEYGPNGELSGYEHIMYRST